MVLNYDEISLKKRINNLMMQMDNVYTPTYTSTHNTICQPKKNISKKSNKKRINQNIDKLIEKYFEEHPDVLNKYIENYLKNNLRVQNYCNYIYGKANKFIGLHFKNSSKPFTISSGLNFLKDEDYKNLVR